MARFRPGGEWWGVGGADAVLQRRRYRALYRNSIHELSEPLPVVDQSGVRSCPQDLIKMALALDPPAAPTDLLQARVGKIPAGRPRVEGG